MFDFNLFVFQNVCTSIYIFFFRFSSPGFVYTVDCIMTKVSSARICCFVEVDTDLTTLYKIIWVTRHSTSLYRESKS